MWSLNSFSSVKVFLPQTFCVQLVATQVDKKGHCVLGVFRHLVGKLVTKSCSLKPYVCMPQQIMYMAISSCLQSQGL